MSMVPGQEQRLNIDISKYIEQKEKGTVRIVKINGVTHYALRRFDPDKGTPIPALVQIDADSVRAQKDALLAVIASLDAVAADIAAAVEV